MDHMICLWTILVTWSIFYAEFIWPLLFNCDRLDLSYQVCSNLSDIKFEILKKIFLIDVLLPTASAKYRNFTSVNGFNLINVKVRKRN